MKLNTPLLGALLLLIPSCDKQTPSSESVKGTEASINDQPIEAPTQAPSAPTIPAKKTRTLVEHKCDISPTYIQLTASFAIESDYQGSSDGRYDGPFRDFIEVSCTQCVGEDFSYGQCGKQYTWSCDAHRIHLNGIDQGKPLTGPDVVSYRSMQPTKSAKKVVKSAELILAHLDDSTRFAYFDDTKKSKLRKRAQRIKDIASALPDTKIGKGWVKGKHDHALFDFSDGAGKDIIAIHEGKAHLLFTGSNLAYAVADCSSKP